MSPLAVTSMLPVCVSETLILIVSVLATKEPISLPVISGELLWTQSSRGNTHV